MNYWIVRERFQDRDKSMINDGISGTNVCEHKNRWRRFYLISACLLVLQAPEHD